MTHVPLGMDGFPPWDVWCIHYTCNPHRTDVLMRASHIIGDGQLFMKIIKQIMDPLDATAAADYAATVLVPGADDARSDARSPHGCKDTGVAGTIPAAAAADSGICRTMSADRSSSCRSLSSSPCGSEVGSSSCSGESVVSSYGDLESSSSIISEEGLPRKATADCMVLLQPAAQPQKPVKKQNSLQQLQQQSHKPLETAQREVQDQQQGDPQPQESLQEQAGQEQQQQTLQRQRQRRSPWQRLLLLFSMLWR